MSKNNLEDRLIDFAILVINITEKIKRTYLGIHMSNQLNRSGTSPALNYSEAESAESRKDFIHKLKVVLKELRETHTGLRIVLRANLYQDKVFLQKVIDENNELVAIFVTSVNTARKNQLAEEHRNAKNKVIKK